jgi:hypothetical protein
VNARWSHFLQWGALVLAVLAFVSLPIAADAKRKAKEPPPFTKAEQVLQWINEYRHHPEPERLPDAVRAMRELLLLKDIEQAGIYVGFIAGVIGANPDKAETLIADMFPMPPPDQVVVVKAIAYSGLSEWKALMGKFVERMPARKVVIERYLYGKLPVLRDLPLDSPIAVDANWGYYFATGSSEPIQRLVRILAWSREGRRGLTVGSMVSGRAELARRRLLGSSSLHRRVKIIIAAAAAIESAEPSSWRTSAKRWTHRGLR